MVRLISAHNTSAPAGRPAILADGGMPVTMGPVEVQTPAAPTVSNATISPSSGNVGDTFTASATVTGYPTPTRTYVWELDGVPIADADEVTYQAASPGSLTVVVSATNSEGGPISDESDPVTVALPAPIVDTASIDPTSGQVGDTFVASHTASGGPGNVTYQWELDTVAISGATESLYVSTAIGSLTVTVTVTNATGSDSLTSAAATVSAATSPTFVGATTQVVAANGTENITLPGPPIEGDVVIVVCGSDNTLDGVADGVMTSGYTLRDNGAGIGAPGCYVVDKTMGATPDTTVQVKADLNRQAAVAVQVWRGLDASSLDAAVVVATGSTGMPDAGAVTTNTAGAIAFAIGVLDDDAVDVTTPSGWSNMTFEKTTDADPTANATVMIASQIVASPGATNPAAFGGAGSDNWRALTYAFRPGAPAQPSALEPYAFLGYGAATTGGRGGKFVRVTSLSSSASTSGSLPWAFQQHIGEPIYIAICVEGRLNFTSQFNINRSNWTLDGRYAPGNGFWMTGRRIRIVGSNFVVQNIAHLGNPDIDTGGSVDCLSIGDFGGSIDCNNFVLARCEFKHSEDENLSFWARASDSATGPKVTNGTVQDCIIGDSGRFAFIIGDGCENISVVRNLMTNSDSRYPAIKNYTSNIQVINNLMYNFSVNTTQVVDTGHVDFVSNVWRPGNRWTTNPDREPIDLNSPNDTYASDNVLDLTGVDYTGNSGLFRAATPQRATPQAVVGYTPVAGSGVDALIAERCGPRLYAGTLHALTQESIDDAVADTGPAAAVSLPGPLRSTTGASYPAHTGGVPDAYLAEYPDDTDPEAIISGGAWDGLMVAQRIGRWHEKPAPAVPSVDSATISPSSGQVGDTFTIDYTASGGAATPSYQWKLDGATISGAVGDTHVAASAGSLTCVVTLTNATGSDFLESGAVTVAAAPGDALLLSDGASFLTLSDGTSKILLAA